MTQQEWGKYAQVFNEHMGTSGVFLTTAADGKVNTMTMGWGSAGYFWVRPVITVPVRLTRFTREWIVKTGFFTLSIPKAGELAKELAYCGTRSGRNEDKLAACGLKTALGHRVSVPVIAQAHTHFECHVLYSNDIGKLSLDPEVSGRYYADLDYHTLFMAEVLDCYER